ncbi:hypothetical protein OAQ99_07160, partial [Candidatus Kapabacteria bacterium]|nr:hypothetical protein [Candidatus Kapabacteria bacterium]
IDLVKYKPEYSWVGNKIRRQIDFSMSCFSNNFIANKSFVDTINYEDIEYIEESEFDFDKAVVPKKDGSFFKKYLEPIIIVGSTLVTVFLLFTVRSS